MSSLYTHRFYEEVMVGSASSAGVVVPLVLSLVPARSVCDVGCGAGDWLRAFMENGVDDIVGVDGAYVSSPILRIPQDKFYPHDLATQLNLSRQFDLAISLEVAEHLPKRRAVGFVKDLTRLSPVVLFSAAVPGQGGIGHVNEQWQHYWAETFARFQFTAFDAVRPRIWTNRSVKCYYRQNILLYCHEDYVRHYPALSQTVAQILSVAHPEGNCSAGW